MSLKKVAVCGWAPFWGGAEVAAERLALGLQQAGMDVVMVVGTKGEALARYEAAGLRCLFAPMVTSDKWKFWRTMAMRRTLGQIFQRERPDVVHANDLPTGQMIGRTALEQGLPRVVHHRWVFDGPAVDWLNKYGAERHVFVSRYLMNTLSGPSKTLTRSPCTVVYDGLLLPYVPSEEDKHAARKSLGLAPGKQHVLLAGQVIERKGIADALHAWAMLPETERNAAELHVVGDDLEGDGAYRRKMEGLASDLRISARYHGFRRDVPAWLCACDMVLVPSHVEPLGNATLEAMAMARPVIGSNVGGIPEMVVNEVTGLLVPAKDPAVLASGILRLLHNQAEARRMGARARARCEELFSLGGHAQAMLREFESAVREHRAARRA